MPLVLVATRGVRERIWLQQRINCFFEINRLIDGLQLSLPGSSWLYLFTTSSPRSEKGEATREARGAQQNFPSSPHARMASIPTRRALPVDSESVHKYVDSSNSVQFEDFEKLRRSIQYDCGNSLAALAGKLNLTKLK